MKNKEFISKITLGTAQLGFPYGIANQIGEVSSINATEILRQSINMKINFLHCLSTPKTLGYIYTQVLLLLIVRVRATIPMSSSSHKLTLRNT